MKLSLCIVLLMAGKSFPVNWKKTWTFPFFLKPPHWLRTFSLLNHGTMKPPLHQATKTCMSNQSPTRLAPVKLLHHARKRLWWISVSRFTPRTRTPTRTISVFVVLDMEVKLQLKKKNPLLQWRLQWQLQWLFMNQLPPQLCQQQWAVQEASDTRNSLVELDEISRNWMIVQRLAIFTKCSRLASNNDKDWWFIFLWRIYNFGKYLKD